MELENSELPYLTYDEYLKQIDPRTREYHDEKLRNKLISTFTSIIFMILLVVFNAGNFISVIFQLDNTYTVLGVILHTVTVITIIFLFGLFSSYKSESIERKYEFSTLTNSKWIKRQLKGWLIFMIIGIPIMIGTYKLIDEFVLWWFYAFIGYLVFMSVLQFIMPVLIMPLFFKLESFPEGPLRDRMEKLANDMNINYKDIYLWKLSDATKKVNAAVMGFGSSLRIVLGDTLVKEFREDEIEVVMCHEIGHQKSKDIYRGLLFSGILTLFTFYMISLLSEWAVQTFNYNKFSNPASIIFFFTSFMIIQEFIGIAYNWHSRSREKAADLTALKHLKDIKIYESAFTRLSKTSLSYPDPSSLEILFYYSHPPIKQRIAYAKKYMDKLNSTL